jgi:hypothetical protein
MTLSLARDMSGYHPLYFRFPTISARTCIVQNWQWEDSEPKFPTDDSSTKALRLQNNSQAPKIEVGD